MIDHDSLNKKFVLPKTLEPGQHYWMASEMGGIPTLVELLAYDPCPEFVIVRLPAGKRVRCERAKVFASP